MNSTQEMRIVGTALKINFMENIAAIYGNCVIGNSQLNEFVPRHSKSSEKSNKWKGSDAFLALLVFMEIPW